MTTDPALRAIRESIELAAASRAEASEAVREQIEAAIEYYALNYSRFGPALLFDEVRRTRMVVASLMASTRDRQSVLDLQRATGWLSALLGNLAFHLDDYPGARAHLAAAVQLGRDAGDARLAAWTSGAQSMLARYEDRLEDALLRAQEGHQYANTPLLRAQLLSWAQLPALAALGREVDADRTLGMALRELESAPDWSLPGRFGFDPGELELHAAEAHLLLRRSRQAVQHATASAGYCRPNTPGWVAATLVAALAESQGGEHDHAAGRALVVLDRVRPASLRSTSRRRLADLERSLTRIDATEVRELRERVRALPSLVEPSDANGGASTDTDLSTA
jgi:hypothetical protein